MNLTESQFEQLFRQHYASLYRQAYQLLADEEESRDTVSEAFAQLWEMSIEGEIKASHSLPAWLATTVRNRSLNLLKHRQCHQKAIDLYPKELRDMLLPDLPFRSKAAEERCLAELISFVRHELTPQDRKVIELCYFEGLSYKDAASQLNISKAAVNKHIVHGLKQLRSHFKAEK